MGRIITNIFNMKKILLTALVLSSALAAYCCFAVKPSRIHRIQEVIIYSANNIDQSLYKKIPGNYKVYRLYSKDNKAYIGELVKQFTIK